MSIDPLGLFFVHSTSVKRYTGTTGYGVKTYAAPVSLACLVDDTTKVVRDAAGAEVTSSTTVFYPAGTARIPPESLVTLPAVHGGREAEVISSSVQDAGSLPLPAHLEVHLT